MKLGTIACAMGRHSIKTDEIRQIHGMKVARCRRCSTALEFVDFEWMPIALRSASLGGRKLS